MVLLCQILYSVLLELFGQWRWLLTLPCLGIHLRDVPPTSLTASSLPGLPGSLSGVQKRLGRSVEESELSVWHHAHFPQDDREHAWNSPQASSIDVYDHLAVASTRVSNRRLVEWCNWNIGFVFVPIFITVNRNSYFFLSGELNTEYSWHVETLFRQRPDSREYRG